jgi:hypothetical protein
MPGFSDIEIEPQTGTWTDWRYLNHGAGLSTADQVSSVRVELEPAALIAALVGAFGFDCSPAVRHPATFSPNLKRLNGVGC